MTTLFVREDQISCRGCGGTAASPAGDKRALANVCEICWRRFMASIRGTDKEITQANFNVWLARQLFLQAQRLKTYGVMGRCEAITTRGAMIWSMESPAHGGYQCGSSATMIRDGRRVCPTHGTRAVQPVYVGVATTNPYDDFGRLVAEMSLLDEQFFQCVKAAVAIVDAQRDAEQ